MNHYRANSLRANILNAVVQIRLVVARIPNGTGEVLIAHIRKIGPRYLAGSWYDSECY